MNSAIEQMLKSYHVENIYDRKNAMKEIMQEIVLCGLSRAGFFKKAAFYGGTAVKGDVVFVSVGPDKVRLVFTKQAIASIEDSPVEATLDGEIVDSSEKR